MFLMSIHSAKQWGNTIGFHIAWIERKQGCNVGQYTDMYTCNQHQIGHIKKIMQQTRVCHCHYIQRYKQNIGSAKKEGIPGFDGVKHHFPNQTTCNMAIFWPLIALFQENSITTIPWTIKKIICSNVINTTDIPSHRLFTVDWLQLWYLSQETYSIIYPDCSQHPRYKGCKMGILNTKIHEYSPPWGHHLPIHRLEQPWKRLVSWEYTEIYTEIHTEIYTVIYTEILMEYWWNLGSYGGFHKWWYPPMDGL